nr:cadherin-like domain-containing protein [Gammaproteobacteria bacterium]
MAKITGKSGNVRDTLTGTSGADTLNGLLGADVMRGLGGNDLYVVDNVGDVVTEVANAGTDTVQSSVNHTLRNHVEDLTLTGTSAKLGTGNTLNNVLTGNTAANTLTGLAGNDTLDGKAGADRLVGGVGNDTYVVDSASDVIVESAGQGTDLVQSNAAAYTLAANVDNLTLLAATARSGKGNSSNNLITGNASANTLDGGAGTDTLVGGAGNDTYLVDLSTDKITEIATGGTADTVISTASSYLLSAFVENLTLKAGASTARSGTGNTGNNVIIGNEFVNTLAGGAGNDTINGGAGADTLDGGAGNDVVIFDAEDAVVNGGADTDILRISATGEFLDLAALTDENVISGFERLDLGNNGTTVTLTPDAVKALSDTDALVLDGGADDSVDLGAGWVKQPSTGVPAGYDRYQNIIDSVVNATVDIKQGVQVSLNRAPTGAPTATLLDATEDTEYTIEASDLLSGFSDLDEENGDSLSVTSVTAENGTVVDNGDGTFTYTPDVNYNGPETFSYVVSDTAGETVAAQLSIDVTAVNDAPDGNDTGTLPAATEDTPYTIALGDLLAGFTDVDGDTLSVIDLSVDQGLLVDNEDGTYTYSSPEANFHDEVTFSYTVADGNGGTFAATRTLNVAAVNDAPTGTPSTVLASATEDQSSYTLSLTDLLNGISDADIDTDDDAISISGSILAAHGTVVPNGSDGYTYTPDANYSGPETFSYTVTDNNGATLAATLGLTVTSVNDAPTGSATSSTVLTTAEDTAVDINQSEFLTGFSDVDTTDVLVVSSISANHGTVVDNGNGTFRFTPELNYNGPNVFTYTVSDGNGGTVAGTRSLTVTAVNDAPALTGAQTTLSSIAEDATGTIITKAQLLAGFSDVEDGTTLTVSNVTADNGALVDNLDGTYTFTPTANFRGTNTFSYTVTDTQSGTLAATLGLTVTAVNNVPALTGTQTTLSSIAEDATGTIITKAQLLTGFSDVEDGTTLTVSNLTANNGSVVENLDGTYTFTPTANFNGTNTFRYTVNDTQGGTLSASLALTVTAVNDAPALTGTQTSLPSIAEDATGTIITKAQLLAGFSDVEDGTTLTVSNLTANNGAVVENLDGTYTFTPTANFNGTNTFSYTVNDTQSGTLAATLGL